MVPVPAHRERLRRHGFNQAESLANALARAKGLPVKTLLRRQQGARPQVGLERRARLEGPSASVWAMGPVPARAVVVDDVYTTGATLDACARALRERGAREVVAVTFSRALRGHLYEIVGKVPSAA
jgi:predicted amidophosphoribosyltransferase